MGFIITKNCFKLPKVTKSKNAENPLIMRITSNYLKLREVKLCTQNPPVAIPCRFESGHRHHLKNRTVKPFLTFRYGFSFYLFGLHNVVLGFIWGLLLKFRYKNTARRMNESLCRAALIILWYYALLMG